MVAAWQAHRGGQASSSSARPPPLPSTHHQQQPAPLKSRRHGVRGQPALCPRAASSSSSSTAAATAPPPSHQEQQQRARAGTGALEHPPWAGETPLSRAVNAALGIKPLFAVLKLMAKGVLKRTANAQGVPWDATLQELKAAQPQLEELRRELEDPTVQYPSYYLQAFHGYDEGNLCWEAAGEVEAATHVMGLRTFPRDELTFQAAQARLRAGILDNLREYAARHGISDPRRALDVGCSVGLSTRYLAEAFPAAAVTGLDLSPQFLAVAELRRRGLPEGLQRRIAYRHANMEASGLPSGELDLVVASFVVHECPPDAIRGLVAEARRLLRPGGVLAIADNDPRSATLQSLPPALFTLMKSTEPWSDLYYQMDIEGAIASGGFAHVETREADHRHRVILAVAAE